MFSELLSSTTPFLLTYWCSSELVQGILLRFYSSRAYRWALTSAIFGLSLWVLTLLVFVGLSNRISLSKFFLLRPSFALIGWLLAVYSTLIPNLSSTSHDALPAASFLAVICSLFMFAGGAFLGDLQQRALGIHFSWWWLLASGLVWAVGTVVFFMGAFLFILLDLFKLLDFYKGYASILALLISGVAGSFIKGISLVVLFNRERLRNPQE